MTKIPPAWQRHLRDPDVWHVLAITSLAVLGTAGLVWLLHCHRVWRTARSAASAPAGAGHVLLFGKRLRRGAADADLLDRVAGAHRLVRGDRVHSLLLLGGRTDEGSSEAAFAHRLLRERGIPDQLPVRLEEASGDTLENLRHARALLAAESVQRVVLLSSRYHLARCALLARSIGLDHELCAAEQSWQPGARHWLMIAREASLSLCLDAGIRWARLIGHRRMLSKVN